MSSLAPPADQVAFYSKWQVWFAIGIAFLSGTGQFFFWKKMDKARLRAAMTLPVLVSLVLSALIFILAKVNDPVYIVVLIAGVYSIVSNTKILIDLLKAGSRKLIGGSIAHIGIAMILIGIMFSEGYSRIVSKNTTTISRDFTQEQNENMIVLFLNDPKPMAGYQLIYKSENMEALGIPGYVKKSDLRPTEETNYWIAKQDIIKEDQLFAQSGDTLYFRNPENTFHEVEYTSMTSGRKFTLYPRTQVNEEMGSTIVSPDIKKHWNRDLYTFVALQSDFDDEFTEWSEKETKVLKPGNRFFINDYVAEFEGLERIPGVNFMELGTQDAAVQANIIVYVEEGAKIRLQPKFIIKDNTVGRPLEMNQEIASRITLENIIPADGSIELGIETTQKDWIILQAIEKPQINILWIGTIVMIIGFIIATRRRYIEFVKMRDRGVV
jgi:cytochrome c-type biogenesis protein CcmF